ncbi:hypothetical protein Vafri_225 [Volvox africanus]|nr:hypothetical protein Vafri_225 [Volvox africanus]
MFNFHCWECELIYCVHHPSSNQRGEPGLTAASSLSWDFRRSMKYQDDWVGAVLWAYDRCSVSVGFVFRAGLGEHLDVLQVALGACWGMWLLSRLTNRLAKASARCPRQELLALLHSAVQVRQPAENFGPCASWRNYIFAFMTSHPSHPPFWLVDR